MKMILTLLAALSTLSAPAIGQVKDPYNLMGQIDAFVDAKEFNQAFVKKDSATIETQECVIYSDGDNSYMECEVEEEKQKVVSVTSNYALFQNNFALLKTVYEKNKRNPLRFWLENTKANLAKQVKKSGFVGAKANEGYLRLDSVARTSFQVNGVHDALRVDMSMVMIADDGAEIPLPMYMIVAKGLPFTAQIAQVGLELEINGLKFPPLMKVIDYKKN